MTPLARRCELGAFLRSRRQRLDPEDHGFDRGRRSAPGLRREEVAALAGVSLSWYTWLEQARDIRASAQVLTSIGRALSLDAPELDYLLCLGGHAPAPAAPADRPDPDADPQLRALTDGFLPNPASIITPAYDYVAWNRASERLVPGFLGGGEARTYNLARFMFADEAGRRFVNSLKDGVVRSFVAELRGNAARSSDDNTIGELAEELSDASAEFARLWRLTDLAPTAPPRRIQVDHPTLGPLAFGQTLLTPDLYPDLTLVVFLPFDDVTASRLADLAAQDGAAMRQRPARSNCS